MRRALHVFGAIHLCVAVSVYGQTVAETLTSTPGGANHRIWTKVAWETNSLSEVLPLTNSYVELATGLHFLGPSGDWQASEPGFELTEAGHAVASRGQHQVIVSANLNSPDGVIDFQTPDGKRLRSGVIGLTLFDPYSGKSLQIAAVRDSIGTQIATNEIVWFDAFDGLAADVRVRNELGAFHQDIILREKLSEEQLASLGFDAKTVRLEVWTEFFESVPPTITTQVVRSETNATVRALIAQPDEVDQRVDFGAMRMEFGSGKALMKCASARPLGNQVGA